MRASKPMSACGVLSISARTTTGIRGGNHPTLFRNICIEDVTCNRVDSVALMANGLPEAKLHNITLRNINVKKAPKAIQMENVVNLTLDNVVVNGEKVTAP